MRECGKGAERWIARDAATAGLTGTLFREIARGNRAECLTEAAGFFLARRRDSRGKRAPAAVPHRRPAGGLLLG